MDSIEDNNPAGYDPLAQVEAELGLDRLRGRTDSLIAAASRLVGETDYAVNSSSTRQESVDRLRPAQAGETPSARGLDSPQMQESLRALASTATRVVAEIDRVSEIADRHVEVLKGTDLGYEVREALKTVRAFTDDITGVCSAPERYEPFASDDMRRLSEEIAAAVSALGADYAVDAERRRRLRRGR